jgi:hypothetical protein
MLSLDDPKARSGFISPTYARPASATARDRTYVHRSNLPEGAKPVRPGWQFSFVAVVPTEASSWVYTLDVERIPSEKTPVETMGDQLEQLIALLDVRPLFLGDGGYGNAAFLLKTCDIACDRLLRIAKNRVLYRPKPPRPDKPGRDVFPKMERSFGVKNHPPTAPPTPIGKAPMTRGSVWKWTVGTACISRRHVTSRFRCCA